MEPNLSPPLVAIDGGGTHCRFLAVTDRGRFTIKGGTANVSTDFDTALAVLSDGLSALANAAGVPRERLMALPAFVGIAGVTGPEMETRISRALPFRHVRVSDDWPAAVRGALGAADGCVAHCGTGSFFAAQTEGTTRHLGGWGSVLGDEASAMWLGRRLLAETLNAVDGLVPHSDATRAVLQRFEDAPGIVRFAATAGPAEFGAFAPDVTQAAAQADPVAIRLVDEAAAHVAQMLETLGWSRGIPICLTGGLAPCYADRLPLEMQDDHRTPVGTPLDGAEALARDFANELAQ